MTASTAKLDAPRRRAALEVFTDRHEDAVFGVLFSFGGIVALITIVLLAINAFASIGPDNGDEAPWPLVVSGLVYLPLWLTVTYFVCWSRRRHTVAFDRDTNSEYQKLVEIHEQMARLKGAGNSSIRDAADAVYKDLVLLMKDGEDYDREEVEIRLDVLQDLADEAELQIKEKARALISTQSVQHAHDVLLAARAARKELTP